MMWVKLTLPPRERMRWLLRTLRLTSRRRAGTWRKLVAVGTDNDRSIFSTIRAAAPRIGVPASEVAGPVFAPSALVAGSCGCVSAPLPLGAAAGAGACGAGAAAATVVALPAPLPLR